MSTYGEKVREYAAKVRMARDLGLEPSEKDLKKLVYYYGRAEKKGWDYTRTTMQVAKDRIRYDDGYAKTLGTLVGAVAPSGLGPVADVVLKLVLARG